MPTKSAVVEDDEVTEEETETEVEEVDSSEDDTEEETEPEEEEEEETKPTVKGPKLVKGKAKKAKEKPQPKKSSKPAPSKPAPVAKGGQKKATAASPFPQANSIIGQAWAAAVKGTTLKDLETLVKKKGGDPRRILRIFRAGTLRGYKWKIEEDKGRIKILF